MSSLAQTKPELHNTNTSNSGPAAGKSVAVAHKKVNVGGLHLPAHQAVHVPADQKHEILIIPASSTANWGSYYTIDIREKNILLHNLTLQMNYGVVTGSGLTGYFNPSFYHWTRIEVYQCGAVIDTIYGNQQFLFNQMLFYDEDRTAINYAAGCYGSTTAAIANRTALSSTSTTNTFYCPLRTYFDQTKMALLTDNHAIQLRVYTETLANAFYVTAGSITSCPINSVNAICEVTRLDSAVAHNQLVAMQSQPHHYICHDNHYGTWTIPANTSLSTIVLSSIVGPIAALIFTVRQSMVATSATVNPWSYIPITSFHLLDAASTSLTGGQSIPSTLATNILNSGWVKSSYNTEQGFGPVDSKANMYMWSFSADIISSLEHGRCLGSRKFNGNEQLQLVLPTNGNALTLDVYAIGENILEQTEFSIKKIAM